MMATRWHRRLTLGAILAIVVSGTAVRAQLTAPAQPPASPAQTVEPEKDPLGRDTPRGTVIGFMAAARDGKLETASAYLNVTVRDHGTPDLARRLYVVLDSRLPARLNQLSDRAEGSLANPLKPDQDVVGTISTNNGPLDIVVEHVSAGASGRVWLFSGATLDAVPAVYDEIHLVAVEPYLPRVLTARIGGIRLFEWLAFFVGIPVIYRVIGLFGRLSGPATERLRRRYGLPERTSKLTPGPLRLILIALAIRWLLSSLDLPLFERQFWFATARVLATVAIVWAGLLLNGFGERYLDARLRGSSIGDSALLRLGRRLADVLVVAAGMLIVLEYFAVDPTAALAGLGIGGIAVALSAQKTLENVIGGVSIIFDKAVRVGDFLKLGDIAGTVDYIGLRSTRIRTLDRTIVSVPNGQIANVNIETLSVRDKFWFHHFVALSYETTAEQLRAIADDFRNLLDDNPRVDKTTIRARIIRLGSFSIDVEVFAYVFARDWNHFLEIQEALLLDIVETVERRGATIAFPTQTVHFAGPEGGAVAPGVERADADSTRRAPDQPAPGGKRYTPSRV
jgi:MscS family membrane protein